MRALTLIAFLLPALGCSSEMPTGSAVNGEGGQVLVTTFGNWTQNMKAEGTSARGVTRLVGAPIATSLDVRHGDRTLVQGQDYTYNEETREIKYLPGAVSGTAKPTVNYRTEIENPTAAMIRNGEFETELRKTFAANGREYPEGRIQTTILPVTGGAEGTPGWSEEERAKVENFQSGDKRQIIAMGLNPNEDNQWTLETQARNNYLGKAGGVLENGPAVLESDTASPRLIKSIQETAQTSGVGEMNIALGTATSAGTFDCNKLLYTGLAAINPNEVKDDSKMEFYHMPTQGTPAEAAAIVYSSYNNLTPDDFKSSNPEYAPIAADGDNITTQGPYGPGIDTTPTESTIVNEAPVSQESIAGPSMPAPAEQNMPISVPTSMPEPLPEPVASSQPATSGG